MGIWADHFHHRVLLRWEVLGWIVATLLAVGGIVLVFDQYLIANICFVVVTLFLFFKVVAVAISYEGSMANSLMFAFLLCGLLGAGITATVRGVSSFRYRKAQESKPSLQTSSEPMPLVGSEPSKTDKSSSELDPIEISLDIDSVTLPIEVPPGEIASIAFLKRQWNPNLDVPLYSINNIHSHEITLWPIESMRNYIDQSVPHKTLAVWRCVLVNHGDKNITQVSIPFFTRFHPYQKNTILIGPSVPNEEYRKTTIVVGPLHRGKSETFYIANDCPIATSTLVPSNGTARVVGEAEQREFEFQFRNRRRRKGTSWSIGLRPSPINFSQMSCD